MTDEDKKRIVSEPPPPTDEIDGEWGDDDQTLIRDAASVSNSQPAPAQPAVPKSAPPKAAEASTPAEMKAVAAIVSPVEGEEEDEGDDDDVPATNEDDEEDDDEQADEEEEEEDDGDVPAAARGTAAASSDRLPDWAPYAVLAGLVAASIVFGLGLLGGSAASSDESEKTAEPAASTVKAPAKPSPHP